MNISITSPDSAETSFTNKLEIYSVSELEKLPEGVCLLPSEMHSNGNRALGEFIERERKKLGELYGVIDDSISLQGGEYLVGPTICGFRWGSNHKIVQKILEQFPNLCWFRGTTYLENEDGVPALTAYPSIGANGYVGDARALSYAERSYSGDTHSQTVLFMVPLKAMITGVETGAIELGTEHNYDVTISPRSPGYNDWALRNLIVCDLGNSPDDIQKAREILSKKATVL